jgi:hypothetical protein
MRWVVVVALAGCYSAVPAEGVPCGEPPEHACPRGQICGPDNRCSKDPASDVDAAPGEAGPDGPPAACTPKRLLTGGQSAMAQGWTIEGSGSRMYNESNGLTTLTTTNGHQMLVRANALPVGARWGLQVEMTVVSSGGHAANAAAIALMASYRAPMGDDGDRKKMLFVDNANVGWGDGTVMIGVMMQQAATVKLESTTSGGLKATVMAGGGGTMTTPSFTTNGTIAIGDQTTAMGLDSMFQISSIDLYCP